MANFFRSRWPAGPLMLLNAALVVGAMGYAGNACPEGLAAPCTAPTPECAATLPKRRAEPPIQYDAQRAHKRQAFLTLYARTAACMRESVVAALSQQVRDREAVRSFAVRACGSFLGNWLMAEEDFTQDEAISTLRHMADKAIETALRDPDAIIVR